jgi:hypothetical protein
VLDQPVLLYDDYKFEAMKQVFGNPRTIITNRGSAFTCTDFQQYCTDENIKHINVTTGVPRGNGQVERINRIIISVLTKLSFEKPEAWYRQVRPLQEALNSTHQRSINTSPFKLLFGVKMLRSEDIRLQEVIEEEYAKLFIEERDEIRKEAKQQTKKIQKENIKNYNRKRKMAKEYKPGDQVAIERTQFKTSAKILPKYLGPYEVVKKIRNDRYDVKKIGTHDGPKTTKSCAEMVSRRSRFVRGERISGWPSCRKWIVGEEEFFCLLVGLTLYDRDVTIYHYKVVTNLVCLNYIPHV